MRDVVLLGSTGSIGTQALDVIAAHPAEFRVVGLAAGGSDVTSLAQQARRFNVPMVAIADERRVRDFRDAYNAYGAAAPEILSGPDAATELAAYPCDVVLNGITGSIGLAPTLAALQVGSRVALANKESLVAGGPLVRPYRAQLTPVDSEHSALAQVLRSGTASEVARLIITASGGPFRDRTDFAGITPEQALAHPTWTMGPVVTINSATLVNKGLEVIEAHELFDIPFDRIDVVVHPQSIVHSLVEFGDGSTIAQASQPDMRLPIALALSWPHRLPIPETFRKQLAVPWHGRQTWQFQPLDDATFPAVALARAVGVAGGVLPAVYNATNEECVAAFLRHALPFGQIVPTIQRVVEMATAAVQCEPGSVADITDAEQWARRQARDLIREKQQ